MSVDSINEPIEIYSKQEIYKHSVELLDNVRSFSKGVYPRMRSLTDKMAEIGGVLDLASKQEATDLIAEIISSPCFDKSKFDFLKSRSLGKTTQAQHDLNNFSVGLFGTAELLRDNLGTSDDIKTIYENWPGFAMALEDVLLHEQKLELKEEHVNQRPLDLDFLLAGINQLVKSGASVGRVKKLFRDQKLPDLNGVLKADEQIISQPAIIGNFLFNEISNASKEVVKADHFNFDVKREGNELVLRVSDNGIGMNSAQLDPNNSKYIFGKGEQSSGTGSTGIGLAEAPERLNKFANAQLRVWSRPKGEVSTPYNVYPPDTDTNIPVASDVSTVFELRLPITKKVA